MPRGDRMQEQWQAGDGLDIPLWLDKTAEWKSATIPAYQRRTRQADALIASAYLSER